MKSTRVRTLRGTITPTGGKADQQLILNDQLINRGLRIKEFYVWPTLVGVSASRTVNAILSYARLGNANVVMDAGDNTQLGWAFYAQSASATGPEAVPPAFSGFFNQVIDPDHIINRDLFISLRSSSSADINYMIVCELLELDDNEAIVTIIKENSQSIE